VMDFLFFVFDIRSQELLQVSATSAQHGVYKICCRSTASAFGPNCQASAQCCQASSRGHGAAGQHMLPVTIRWDSQVIEVAHNLLCPPYTHSLCQLLQDKDIFVLTFPWSTGKETKGDKETQGKAPKAVETPSPPLDPAFTDVLPPRARPWLHRCASVVCCNLVLVWYVVTSWREANCHVCLCPSQLLASASWGTKTPQP
jgi:hypothetical protein